MTDREMWIWMYGICAVRVMVYAAVIVKPIWRVK
jgi:hypothetical protein